MNLKNIFFEEEDKSPEQPKKTVPVAAARRDLLIGILTWVLGIVFSIAILGGIFWWLFGEIIRWLAQ